MGANLFGSFVESTCAALVAVAAVEGSGAPIGAVNLDWRLTEVRSEKKLLWLELWAFSSKLGKALGLIPFVCVAFNVRGVVL